MIRIGSQVPDQVEIAKQALSWITCAKRPLTTAELLHALAIERETSEFDTDSVPQLEDVVSSCAGLVTVDKESDVVRLVHYTTQEYFERTKDEWFPNMERDLAAACVTYLSYTCFGEMSGFGGMYLLRHTDFSKRHDEYPLYDYACCNWGHHVREAGLCTPEIVSFLTSSASNSQASAMVLLSRHTDIYRYRPPVPGEEDKYWMTGMHLVAYFGAKEALFPLISDSASVDLPDKCGRTPLSWAAEKGHTAMVKLLLNLGANADCKDIGGQTPLSWASKRGHEEVVRLLLREGVDPDSKSESGRTPLSKAAANGHTSIVQLLLAAGVEVESRDEDDVTPLLRAVQNGHTGVVQLLCAVGVDVNSRIDHGQTILMRASRWVGDDGCVPQLLDRGADLKARDNNGVTALPWAVFYGNLGIAKILLEWGIDPDTEDAFGMTPLCWAARGGRIDAINMLLHTCNDSIGDKSKKRYEGYLLESAIECSNTEMVHGLLEQGVDLTVQDYRRQTPLHISCHNGDIELSRRLLDMGADIEARERSGYTPLSVVVNDNPDMAIQNITLLLERGADTEARDAYGCTPLVLAVQRNRPEMVKVLLDMGADINARHKAGRTPLLIAIVSSGNDIFELLLERGADIDATDNQGRAPLLCAVESGLSPSVDLLLRNGAGLGKSINRQDTCGMTALMAAVRWGYIDAAKLLLQQKEINPDIGDHYGTTPLSLAARVAPSLHCLEMVKLLLETGRVDDASTDCFGRTPLWWARSARNRDVEALLMEYAGQKDVSEVCREDFPRGIYESEMHGADVYYCDICYRYLKRDTSGCMSWYTCQSCNGGDCDICEECYEAGGRCLDTTGTHCLVRAPRE